MLKTNAFTDETILISERNFDQNYDKFSTEFREEFSKTYGGRVSVVQLNKYETDRFFLQNFQSTTMLIHTFC